MLVREIHFLIWVMRPLLVSLNISSLALSDSLHPQRMKYSTRTTSHSYLLIPIQSPMSQLLTELMHAEYYFLLEMETELLATPWAREKITKQLSKLPSKN
jgi:hypothetical protein